MITGPKYKICKRLGSGVFEKCQTQKFALAEQRAQKTSTKRPKALSDYGRQLIEKQRARFTYGITEGQLSRYVKAASEAQGSDTLAKLYSSLEMRLDNVVYRLGLASTRRLARQMVSHGHITVNGKKVTIPSYRPTVNDMISVREGSKGRALFNTLGEKLKDHTTPTWLSFDASTLEGKVKAVPGIEVGGVAFDIGSVLEVYSR